MKKDSTYINKNSHSLVKIESSDSKSVNYYINNGRWLITSSIVEFEKTYEVY